MMVCEQGCELGLVEVFLAVVLASVGIVRFVVITGGNSCGEIYVGGHTGCLSELMSAIRFLGILSLSPWFVPCCVIAGKENFGFSETSVIGTEQYSFSCSLLWIRPYCIENTASRPISEVKQC